VLVMVHKGPTKLEIAGRPVPVLDAKDWFGNRFLSVSRCGHCQLVQKPNPVWRRPHDTIAGVIEHWVFAIASAARPRRRL
jgi:hypothetical protein